MILTKTPGVPEVDPLEVGPLEVGSGEVGPLEVGTEEVGPLEIGIAEDGPLEVGSGEVGPLEVGSQASYFEELRSAIRLRFRHGTHAEGLASYDVCLTRCSKLKRSSIEKSSDVRTFRL